MRVSEQSTGQSVLQRAACGTQQTLAASLQLMKKPFEYLVSFPAQPVSRWWHHHFRRLSLYLQAEL